MLRTYRAAFAGWVLGGLAAPVATTAVIAVAIDAMCDGGTDCSWGFEYALVVPVLIVCFFASGPALVARFTARSQSRPIERRAARTTRISAAISLVLLYLAAGSGLSGAYIMLTLIAMGVPAAVTCRVR